jgi:DNA-binding NtrC family response regulator
LECSNKFRKAFTDISSNAESTLVLHNWGEHVRELKNLRSSGVFDYRVKEVLMPDKYKDYRR